MAPNAMRKVKKVLLVVTMITSIILGEYPLQAAAGRFSACHPPPGAGRLPPPVPGGTGVGGKSKPEFDLPDVCSVGFPCSASEPEPEANHTTFSCELENQMRDTIWFQCDGDLFYFSVGSGQSVRRLYNDHELGPGNKVSCAWAFQENYKSSVPAWDGNWPEASSCRVGGADGQCRLLFENREVALLAGTGGRRVLGGLLLKNCTTPTPWYAWLFPWTDPCTTYLDNTTRPYVGNIQPSWAAAVFNMDN
ncbi:uncharacterized protein LOC127771709 [Oryza glaberrima]|uniref:DUF7771 domain-containing protein n=1 Tax=Oryza glaberrima TaxID=4538 RepID=I1PK73_ORYGL|nr:uncharacterized protein LOC127771709 [Oryza glaberrima]